MKLTDKQLDILVRNKIVILSTSSIDRKPRAIFVELNKVEDDKIIIANNQMETTSKNLIENKNVFVLVFEKDYHYGLKISGEAQYQTEGEYFDLVSGLETNKDYSPKGAIVVTIKDVIEFS